MVKNKEKTENLTEQTSKKKGRGKKAGKIILCIVAVILVLAIIGTVVNVIVASAARKLAVSYEAVDYSQQLVPEKDADGNWVFTTDREFRVMQLTDVHFGGGWMSASKDPSAMTAVATMIAAEKPDLVIITGDIAYPVPIQAGTSNNKTGADYMALLMETLGVYWTVSLGNHDAEAYSMYGREKVADFYMNEEYEHCIFEKGPDAVDGFGNQVIKVQNSQGVITQAFFVFDSHSYIDGDIFGVFWKYDDIHDNQIEWYANEVKKLNAHNKEALAAAGIENSPLETVKSLAFFHIPLEEYKFAWQEFMDSGYKDTENVKYRFGIVGETGELIYPGVYENHLFETMQELGSTKGIFCGHDHLNNFSLVYKGIELNYSYSVDYLAYVGISKKGSQRGCTMITCSPDSSFDSQQYNLYESGRYEIPADFDTDVSMQFDGVEYQYIEEK
ncbi:MAG: metallophosphoesterase [Clostridia bacterium]|nr:metallophosphoesterase [Clostridia bacterium]